MKLAKAMAVVAGTTGISRVAGFVRDLMTAYFLGAGPVADAFVVALKLPNFFRNVTAEGAFSVSFIPIYSKILTTGSGEEDSARFAGQALSVMTLALLGFTAVMMAAMPLVIYVIAPGFHAGTERYDLAVDLARVTFPYLLMMSVASLMGGMLNAHERFGPFAAASIFFNLCQIAVMAFGRQYFATVGHALSWAVTVSGVIQLLWLWWNLRRFKIGLRVARPRLSPEVRLLFSQMGPAVVGAGILHINLFADVIIASRLPAGAISGLYYAERLFQLPLGVVGIAVGTALLPMMTKALSGGKAAEARDLFNRALEYCLFLTIPAAAAMIVMTSEIVTTLFRHGAFTADNAKVTIPALACLALALPPYVGVKIFSSAYWARQDTKTPVKVAAVTGFLNIAVAFSLSLVMGAAGIALATALSGWVQCFVLWRGLKNGTDAGAVAFDSRLKFAFPRIVACAAGMAAVLYILSRGFHGWFDGAILHQVSALGVLVLAGISVYFLLARITGILRPGDVLAALKHSPPADSTAVAGEIAKDRRND